MMYLEPFIYFSSSNCTFYPPSNGVYKFLYAAAFYAWIKIESIYRVIPYQSFCRNIARIAQRDLRV